MLTRREEVQKQSYDALRNYLRRGLLDQRVYDKITALLKLWEQIGTYERRLKEVDAERQKIYKGQQQVQGNMGALSATGKEGALRARYVEQLEASEDQLKTLDQREADFKAEIARLEGEIETRLRALA